MTTMVMQADSGPAADWLDSDDQRGSVANKSTDVPRRRQPFGLLRLPVSIFSLVPSFFTAVCHGLNLVRIVCF